MNFFEQFGDFEFLVLLEEMSVLGLEVEVDSWVGGKALFAKTYINAG